MLKVPKNKKVMLLSVVAIITALAVFAGCQPQSPDKQNAQLQDNTEPAAVAVQPQKQAPEDLKDFTEYTIKEQLGEKSKGGKDRIRSINIAGSGAEKEVVIDLNGNDAFSAEMTVRGMLMDSKKILDLLSKRQDVKAVSVSEYLDVEDIGGGTVEEWVFTLVLDKEGLDKVAGGDYLLNDLPKLAKEYKLHPNLKRD